MTKITRKAMIDTKYCAGCGCCIKACPRGAVRVLEGVYATVNQDRCIGCGLCTKACPTSAITIGQNAGGESIDKDQKNGSGEGSIQTDKVKAGSQITKKWYEYLWIASTAYLILGFFNILFAWLGLICFFVPLAIAVIKGNKAYCNRYCGRGQLFEILGYKLRLSRQKDMPRFLKSRWFRYGFLIFFLVMFCNMLFATWMVFTGESALRETVTLLWTFRLPWHFAYHQTAVAPWVAQFAFGFYSVMLTSTILGILTMLLCKPRSWCAYCPMGTMTQCICRIKHR